MNNITFLLYLILRFINPLPIEESPIPETVPIQVQAQEEQFMYGMYKVSEAQLEFVEVQSQQYKSEQTQSYQPIDGTDVSMSDLSDFLAEDESESVNIPNLTLVFNGENWVYVADVSDTSNNN